MSVSLIISILSVAIALLAIMITEKNNRPWLSLAIDPSESKKIKSHGIKLTLKNIGQSPLEVEWKRCQFFKGEYYYLTFEGNQSSKNLNIPNKELLRSLTLFPNVSTVLSLNLYSCRDHVVYSYFTAAVPEDAGGYSREKVDEIIEELKKIDITISYSWPSWFFRHLRFNTKLMFSVKKDVIDSSQIISAK